MLFGHGDDCYQSACRIEMDFSSNVWHGTTLSGLREYLYRQFDCLSRYPESDAASFRGLSRCYGVEADCFVVTNGSASAFYLLSQACQEACPVIAVPSFAEYGDACRLHGHHIPFSPTKTPLSGLSLYGEYLCRLCNPNNPDRCLIVRAELLDLLESNRRVFFIIDEVYTDFVEDGTLRPSDVREYPDLVLVRSISKAHHVPGFRIGYFVAAPEVTACVSRFLIPWSVNAMTVEGSRYLLSHTEQFVLPLREWLDETDLLIGRVNEQGAVEASLTSSTFFLYRLRRGEAADLKRYLPDSYGILNQDAIRIRTLDERHIHLSTQTREENEALLHALGAEII